MNSHYIKQWCSVTVFLVISFFAYGQKNVQIQLLDLENQAPIVNATFTYDRQSGVSDASGNIYFKFEQGLSLQLSHINYGSWKLTPEEVEQAIEAGTYSQAQINIELHPLTIIALRKSVSPGNVQDLDFIDQVAHDAAAVLRQSPAFNAIQKAGNYGFDPVFRGFKYDQLNIVLNGAQSATAACPNRMDPPSSQMAPNMMDRIEVLKGPHALRYGTGFGATINFIPTALRFSEQNDVYGRLSSAYETNGQVSRSEGRIGLSGKNYDFSLFTAWAQGNDYQSGTGDEVAADFQRGSFGSQLGLQLSDQQELRISALYNRARDADFPALPMDLREDDTWMFNIQHEVLLDRGSLAKWQTSLFGSWVDHKMDNLLKPLNPRMLNATTNAQTYNYGGRTEGTWQLANGRLYTGADLRIEGAEGIRERAFLMGPNAGRTLFDNAWQDSRIQKLGLFSEYHFGLGKYQMVLSGRLEFNQADMNDPADAFTQANGASAVSQVNPNLSIGATRSLGQELKVGLWFGRAQRSGSLTERYINFFPVGIDPYEMLGNPTLAPEINNQVDLGLEWDKGEQRIKLDLFAAYLQDYISSFIDPSLTPRMPTSPGVRRFTNIEEAFKTGVELSYRQSLGLGIQQQLVMAYTYAQDLVLDQPLPEIAPLDIRYILSGQYLNDKLRPQATLRYVATQNRISPEFGETNTPDFMLIDLSITYQILKDLQFNIGVQNLLDRAYYEHLNRSVRGSNQPILAPGRNVNIALSYQI
jgi:iron complex outermembrane receptor protein